MRLTLDPHMKLPQSLRPLAEAHGSADDFLQRLVEALDGRLSEFERSLEADEAELARLPDPLPLQAQRDENADSGSSSRAAAVAAYTARCCVEMLAGEKRILHHWRRVASRLRAAARPIDEWPWYGDHSDALPARAVQPHHIPAQMSQSPPPLPLPSPFVPVYVAGMSDHVHQFGPDGIGWDVIARQQLPRHTEEQVPHVVLAVGKGEHASRGVVVASGSLRVGDLVGCYGGRLLDPAARHAKWLAVGPAFEQYTFATTTADGQPAVVDPTGADGTVSGPPFQWEMALVNEPGLGQLPNVSPLDYELGRCYDRYGKPGVAYYAVRTIGPGEEVLVCFGPNFARDYPSSCTDHTLLGRWSRLQRAVLAPYLRAW